MASIFMSRFLCQQFSFQFPQNSTEVSIFVYIQCWFKENVLDLQYFLIQRSIVLV